MASFNKVVLLGNLTRDPEIRQIPSGSVVASFGIASNRKFKDAAGQDKEEVTFVDCSAFGKVGEIIGQYCKKGRQILVEGRLRYETWEDKTTNAKRSKLTVVVESFQFIGAREDGAKPQSATAKSKSAEEPVPAGVADDGNPPIKDEDIPF